MIIGFQREHGSAQKEQLDWHGGSGQTDQPAPGSRQNNGFPDDGDYDGDRSPKKALSTVRLGKHVSNLKCIARFRLPASPERRPSAMLCPCRQSRFAGRE
jgi:hypothetical protein